MQKMADDTELKAAAERAAKERHLALGLHRNLSIAIFVARSLQPRDRNRPGVLTPGAVSPRVPSGHP